MKREMMEQELYNAIVNNKPGKISKIEADKFRLENTITSSFEHTLERFLRFFDPRSPGLWMVVAFVGWSLVIAMMLLWPACE